MDVAIAWVVWYFKQMFKATFLVGLGLVAWTIITGLM